ncbi:uncharacterized protein LOC135382970 [Ornithodoros turicata]|uniref:uncharacterized protein LOC135382970 n=1 Tax=Ornithodoros turicata TaxID=34597 RepID=UPI00313905EC
MQVCKQCLVARIQENKRDIRTCRDQLQTCERTTTRVIPSDVMHQVYATRQKVEEQERVKYGTRHQRKLNALLPDVPPRARNTEVVNLSSKTLSKDQEAVLGRGLNFAPTNSKIPHRDIVAEVEEKFRFIKDTGAVNLARNRLMGVISKKWELPQNNLTRNERQALQELRTDSTIMILPSDKGKSTVVMDKDAYISKTKELFQDKSRFVELPTDPTQKSERALVQRLRQLRECGSISDTVYKRLFSSDGATPRAYGLPKVHKPDVPLRPIVSFTGAPTYQLSRFLVELLSPIMYKNGHSTKNSREFCSSVRDVVINSDETMVSFDVVSLFTNVPIALVIDVAKDRLNSDDTLSERTTLSVTEVISLLTFCLHETYFKFDNVIYKQIEGCPMGSPVSVSAANLVMEYIEEQVLSSHIIDVKFYKCYVDDTFVVLKRNDVIPFHALLNSVHPNIQFTLEEEENSQLPFLDVLVSRSDSGAINTSVYHKPCDNGSVLDFYSDHAPEHKRAAIRFLFNRSDEIPSTYQAKKSEQFLATNILSKCHYPERFIKDTVSKMCSVSDNRPAPDNIVCIPYVRGLSESVRRLLKPFGIVTTFKPRQTLRNILCHPKDYVPHMYKAGVVYKLECQQCETCYVGETARKKVTRMKEHKAQLTKPPAKNQRTELVDQVLRTGHTFNFDNATTLTFEHR